MTKVVLAAVAAASICVANSMASAQYQVQAQDAWAADAKDWECAMPVERPATNDRNPVYKTEIYLVHDYDERKGTSWLTSFNVRHTLRNGDQYQRSNQYTGIRVQSWKTGKHSGVQQWSGYSVKYGGRMVGELKWVETGPRPTPASFP